jgi:hypothetical protein
MRLAFFFIAASIVFSSCHTQPMVIEEFANANVDKILPDEQRHYVTQEYLVINYKNTAENEIKIDSFVYANMRQDYKMIDAYFIVFYEKSSKVNSIEYGNRKKLCEFEMVDAHIFSYEFRKGSFSKNKVKNSNQIKQFTQFNCSK